MRPETRVASRRVFTGQIVSVRVDTVRLPDGRETQREVVEHPGAAVIVPLRASDEILMVRQFRYTVGETLLELPAGTMQPGETADGCAARELAEEVGARARQYEKLASLFPSPGILTEILHIFLATDLEEGPPIREPDEDLAVERLALSDAVARVYRGEIRDAKSVAGILLAAYRLGWR